ncbi:MAG: amino acid adenylation domain-containing protein, partial [bacterium]|nr:amino acid adenylation domain-containing protein [bacterium]
YKTGDLGRLLPDGNVDLFGRIDRQVKVRGIRVELEEIENLLVKHDAVKEGVVLAAEDAAGELQLRAYIVPIDDINLNDMRSFLAIKLPEHMIPSYFSTVSKIPLTPNGKIDRDALLKEDILVGAEYIAPENDTEKNMVDIWAEVLKLDKNIIGIDANFFDLGGHSLRAANMIAHIQRTFAVQVPLREVFNRPTIREIALYVDKAPGQSAETIEPVEKRDYYPLSSAQKRLFVLQQMDIANTGYNMPRFLMLEGTTAHGEGPLNRGKLEEVFAHLIERHESLRTLFDMVDGEPVQIIEEDIFFEIEYSALPEGEDPASLISDFVQPFDLTQAPLLRVEVVETGQNTCIFMLDMHHIISDGTSMRLLVNDFLALYGDGEPPASTVQYKDYAMRQNSLKEAETLSRQEKYWVEQFSGSIPVLPLPYDNPRPAVHSFAGSTVEFQLEPAIVTALKGITAAENVTLYMVLASVFYVMLSKLGGEEDIVIGSPTAGREHPDVDTVIGMFVNTLAMRNYPGGHKKFGEFLQEVKERTLSAFENQEFQFEDLVERVVTERHTGRNPLFDVIFVLQNLEAAEIEISGLRLKPGDFESEIAKFDLTLMAFEDNRQLLFHFEYCTDLFRRETIKRFVGYFKTAAAAVAADPGIRLDHVEIIGESERHQLLHQFNDTSEPRPKTTLTQLFRDAVESRPLHMALVFGEQQVTYGCLNQRAADLAQELSASGVGPNQPVAIMAERSIEMIVGLVAVLKAGGTYLPVDPTYPDDRIRFMLQDSAVDVLLTACHREIPGRSKGVVDILRPGIYTSKATEPPITIQPDDNAYIIYTSGTTGRPKGVVVQHQNAANTLLCRKEEYGLDEEVRSLQLFSFSFDGFVTSFFTPIISGSLVVLPSEVEIKEVTAILSAVVRNGITHFISVPQFFHALLESMAPSEAASLRVVTLAGDRLPLHIPALALRKNPRLEIAQEYGVTEAAVMSTLYRHQEREEQISIGQPVWNTQIYILDRYNRLTARGVAGELCISGAGTALGYLNRPELTCDKFIPHPFIPGERIYRSGDIARWMENGNLELFGRSDNQVKIRGFRIEVEEIEKKLLAREAVKNVVVTPRDSLKESEGETRDKFLVAYYTAQQQLESSQLRNFLQQELPPYMIPAYFVFLEQLPLTATGKIDRNALPDPEAVTDKLYIPPTTEMERQLVEVWQEVLGIERIGVTDDFFRMGGDSIKAIQVSARARRFRLEMNTRDIFLNSTIRQLTRVVGHARQKKGQEAVAGKVPLTPIQHWFFDTTRTDPHHFNHAVLIYREEGFVKERVETVFSALIRHHDALRMVFPMEDQQVFQYNRGMEEPLFQLEVMDLRERKNAEDIIRETAGRIQGEIDLRSGPLIKLGLFQTAGADYLLAVLHHLVIDGLSWRILLEDFVTAYKQLVNGIKIELQEKTTSFSYWAAGLQKYAQSSRLLKEFDYWKKVDASAGTPLPTDFDVSPQLKKQEHHSSLKVMFSVEETELLLTKVNRPYNTDLNDILLTVLGLSLKEWAGMETICVNLEGHGREPILEDVDIDRTVGWFTTQYPVVLDMSRPGDAGMQIKRVKEMLRLVPRKGIGYGILRYLTPPQKKGDSVFQADPEVTFNYLGEFGQEKTDEADFFQFSTLNPGETVSPQMEQKTTLGINSQVVDKKFRVSFNYNVHQYAERSMKNLAESFKRNLANVIRHCAALELCEATPSDLGRTGLSLEELTLVRERMHHSISKTAAVQAVYPLTPMQKGMLFHAQKEKNSRAYFEQNGFIIKGTIRRDLLEESFNLLLKRHEALRSVFISEGLREPLQFVLEERHAEVPREDVSLPGTGQVDAYISDFKNRDKERGFDLENDILIRLTLLRTAADSHCLLLSFHHILMDGWCIGIVFKELLQVYRGLKESTRIDLPAVAPYGRYIDWLTARDEQAGLDFWSRYLAGNERPTRLPFAAPDTSFADVEYLHAETHLVVTGDLLASLQNLARNSRITLNTLFQTMWGILLLHYNQVDDAVFGIVVSGRPPDVDGIEEMVGLFINTIPVRIKWREKETLSSLLNTLKEEILTLTAFEYIPLAEIQSCSSLKMELLDHIMVFENYPIQQELNRATEGTDSDFTIHKAAAHEQSNYNLNIVVNPGTPFTVKFLYNAHVFSAADMERCGSHLENIARQITTHPDIFPAEIEITSEDEKKQLLIDFNRTRSDYPGDKTIHELFKDRVEAAPDTVAVVFQHHNITYGQLNRSAARLAELLQREAIGPRAVIAVMMKKSIEMCLALMAILKIGGAYMPIGPDYPQERKLYMLNDSRAPVLLTDAPFDYNLHQSGNPRNNYHLKTLLVEDFLEKIAVGTAPSAPDTAGNAETPAYIMYTSGSTGRPKGVMVTHRNVVRLVKNTNYVAFNPGDHILQTGALEFDASTFEIWGALLNGLQLYLAPKETILNPRTLKEILLKYTIATIWLTAPFFNQLALGDVQLFAPLQNLLVGGDALSPSHINKAVSAYPRLNIINGYG